MGFDKRDVLFLILDRDCEDALFEHKLEIQSKNNGGIIYVISANRVRKDDVIKTFHSSPWRIRCMSTYIVLFERLPNVQILDLDIPFGRNGSSFIGLKGITKKEIIELGLLGVQPSKDDNQSI